MKLPVLKWGFKISSVGPGYWVGDLGMIKGVFSVHYSMLERGRYTLECALPGMKKAFDVESEDAGKELARAIVARFVERLYEDPEDAEKS